MAQQAAASGAGKEGEAGVGPRLGAVKMQGNLVAGTTVGALQAVLFNPWDRALYLSVKEKRPFLHRANFTQPFQGCVLPRPFCVWLTLPPQ